MAWTRIPVELTPSMQRTDDEVGAPRRAFSGGENIVGGTLEHPTLTVQYGQGSYVFERTAS